MRVIHFEQSNSYNIQWGFLYTILSQDTQHSSFNLLRDRLELKLTHLQYLASHITTTSTHQLKGSSHKFLSDFLSIHSKGVMMNRHNRNSSF